MHALLNSMPPTLHQATADPHLCQRLLDTHRQDSWVSLLWGYCCFLLGPGAHKVLFVPSKSLFPQSCVSSGSSMVGLMMTFSKKAYDTIRSPAPRAPAPEAGHCRHMPPLETPGLTGKSGSVSCGVTAPSSWVLVHTRFCLCPPRICFPRPVEIL